MRFRWHKSSYSQAQNGCVEVGWRKSSYSESANGCVEVGSSVAAVGVRDSKLGDRSPVLTFSRRAFAAFLAAR
ncbi:DUF397 domain-containing protein [Saccharothrix sp. S26]|uniref:DUF397 domain-containing protein n=1 Tax=Saccharothrix sp. S26 TaxID=2907215 RepID=UPI001F46366A|nr:DUF397 domain-containing protein [Saccharothrix sp. S26]MCE6994166.1 DUF397 domain-containing protein [Saccharothrix sp. S26]